MSISKSALKLFALFCLITFLFTKEAHAYLDPGTGSFILQMALAFILSTLFTIKMFWKKIVIFFKSKFSKGPKNDDAKK